LVEYGAFAKQQFVFELVRHPDSPVQIGRFIMIAIAMPIFLVILPIVSYLYYYSFKYERRRQLRQLVFV